MKKQTAWYKRKGFTLIELVVVIAVIGTLTAATIPTFNGITSTQNLKRSVDNLSADIQLAKDKSLAGTTEATNQTNIVWGIKCYAETGDYDIGYAFNNDLDTFHVVDSKKLEGNATFLTDSCTEPIYFERLTGELINGNDASFKLEAGGEQTSIKIQKAGKVGALKKFCGDGERQDGEDCEPGLHEHGLDSYNKSISDCSPGYDETCNYCTSDTCEKKSVEGPHCGDDIWQDTDEECDLTAPDNTYPDSCTPLYGGTCDYCDASCNLQTNTGGTCGDGVVNGSEDCDINDSTSSYPNDTCTPGYDGMCHYCDSDCTLQTNIGGFCGDGILQSGDEGCDLSAPNNTYPDSCTPPYGGTCDYCDASCNIQTNHGETCGDGTWQQGVEACDYSASNSLPLSCTALYGETCNYCDTNCHVQTFSGGSCGNGTWEEQNEACDSTDINSLPSSCTPSYGESCDYCDSNCQVQTENGAFCGDHVKSTSEICDPSVGSGFNVYDCLAPAGGYCYYCASDCSGLRYKRGASVCNYNLRCEPDLGENRFTCYSDCQLHSICNYNRICERNLGENAFNCDDCRGNILF